jgi:hypothetical protein
MDKFINIQIYVYKYRTGNSHRKWACNWNTDINMNICRYINFCLWCLIRNLIKVTIFFFIKATLAKFLYICIYMYMYICMYTYTYICIYIYIYLYTNIHIHTHMDVNMHMYIRIYIHIYVNNLADRTYLFSRVQCLG